ncbi:MAG: hypothetical protein AB7D43_03180 [Sulfurimonadaceae bacterium]
MAKGIANKINGVINPVEHQEDENIAYEAQHGEIKATPKIPLFEKIKGTVTVKNPLDPLEEKSFSATLIKKRKAKTDKFLEVDTATGEIVKTEIAVGEDIFSIEVDTPFAQKPVVVKKSDVDMVALQAVLPVEDYFYDKDYFVVEIENLQYVLPYFYERGVGLNYSQLRSLLDVEIWTLQDSVRAVLRSGYIGLVGGYGKIPRYYRLFDKTNASFTMNRMMEVFSKIEYTLHPEDRFKDDGYYINFTNEYSDGTKYDLQAVLWYDVEFVKALQNGDETDQALELLDYLYIEGRTWSETNPPENKYPLLNDNNIQFGGACGFYKEYNEMRYQPYSPVFTQSDGWENSEVMERYFYGAYDLMQKISQQTGVPFLFHYISENKMYVAGLSLLVNKIPLEKVDELIARGVLIGTRGSKYASQTDDTQRYLALNHPVEYDESKGYVHFGVYELYTDEWFTIVEKTTREYSSEAYNSDTKTLLVDNIFYYMQITKHLGAGAIERVAMGNYFSLQNNTISGNVMPSVVKRFASVGFVNIPTISLDIESPRTIEVGWKTKTQYLISGALKLMSDHIDYARSGIIGKNFNGKNYEFDIVDIQNYEDVNTYFDPAIDFISGARKIDGRITPQAVLTHSIWHPRGVEERLLLLIGLLSYSEYHDDFAGSYVSFVSNIMGYDLKRSALEENFDLTTLKFEIDGNVISVPMQNPAIVELKQMAQAVYQKLKSEASTHFPESCAKYAAYQVFASNVSRLDISLWSIGHVLMEYHEDWHSRFYYDGQLISTYVYSINDSVFFLFNASGYHPVNCTLTAAEETPYQTDEAVAVMQNFVFNLDGSVEFDISFESLETGEPIAKPDFVKYINLNNGVALFGGE